MIKVLHVLSAVNGGGIESLLLNYYKNFDRNKIHFDLVAHEKWGRLLEKDFKDLGCNVYFIPDQRHMLANRRELKKVIRSGHYDVIHFQHGLGSYAIGLARKLSPKSIIVLHNHSTVCHSGRIRKLVDNYIINKADYLCACGELAGKPYGEKNQDRVHIIYNAIDVEKFKFNNDFRKSIREKYGIGDRFCIGHIGRFENQKNHSFLIDIFNDYHEKNDKAVLLLMGDGKLFETVKQKVIDLHLEDSVIFAGTQQGIERFYSAMDCFVLPSLFEGLPVVGIEAQANGLPVLFADTITKEVKLTENVEFLAINETKEWVENLQEFSELKIDRTHGYEQIKGGKYDLTTQSKAFENFYFELLANSGKDKK